MNRTALAVLMSGLLAMVLLHPCPAQDKLEIYPLGGSDPEALKQAVESLISKDGKVVVDKQNARLLVVASPEEHERIAPVLAELGKPPKNVRIDVQFRNAGTSRESGAGLDGAGSVVISDEGTSTRIKLRPHIISQTTETSSDVKQTLMVASGRDGSLQVGEDVPYLRWLVDYGRQWGLIREEIQWQSVGARLLVQPTVLGDSGLIQVRITPELSGLVDGNPYHVAFQRAATEVTVRNGETISLGGLNKDDEFYSRFLIGFERSRNTGSLDILLTPQIMP